MARPRGFSRRNLVTRSRRETDWGLGPGSTDATPLAGSGSALLGTGISAAGDKLTVVRIRGELLMYLDLITAATDGFVGAFGIGKASLAAFTAGAASVPTPLTEEQWDGWMYHQYFALAGPIIGTTANNAIGNITGLSGAIRTVIDVKAMRKLDASDVIYAAVEVVEKGTANMEVYFNSRALGKLG